MEALKGRADLGREQRIVIVRCEASGGPWSLLTVFIDVSENGASYEKAPHVRCDSANDGRRAGKLVRRSLSET